MQEGGVWCLLEELMTSHTDGGWGAVECCGGSGLKMVHETLMFSVNEWPRLRY